MAPRCFPVGLGVSGAPFARGVAGYCLVGCVHPDAGVGGGMCCRCVW